MVSQIAIEKDDDNKVAVVTLNRPPANALDIPFIREIRETVRGLEEEEKISAVIVQSANPKIFCGGADISTVEDHDVHGMDMLGKDIKELLLDMRASSKIYVALVQGHCLGGGLELALGCDFRFAGDGPAKIGLPEINLGLFPGGGGIQLVGRLIGQQKAFLLAATGKPISVQEAFAYGLLDFVYPEEEIVVKAKEFASQLANGPSVAISNMKQAVYLGLAMSIEQAFDFERQMHKHLVVTDDCYEGVSAYKEKRPPRFSGK